jgi:hypothetical protein
LVVDGPFVGVAEHWVLAGEDLEVVDECVDVDSEGQDAVCGLGGAVGECVDPFDVVWVVGEAPCDRLGDVFGAPLVPGDVVVVPTVDSTGTEEVFFGSL